MRRKDREITDITKLLAIVEECQVVRIGMTDEMGPYIVPLNFGYEYVDGKLLLYLHGALEGRKCAAFRTGKVVAVEMDCGHELKVAEVASQFSYYYQSIIGTGIPEELTTAEDKLHGLNLLMKHVYKEKKMEIPLAALKAVGVFKITLKEFSGKAHEKA